MDWYIIIFGGQVPFSILLFSPAKKLISYQYIMLGAPSKSEDVSKTAAHSRITKVGEFLMHSF